MAHDTAPAPVRTPTDKLRIELVRPRHRDGLVTPGRFDVKALYRSVPEDARRNNGSHGIKEARKAVKRALGDDFGKDNSAPVARFDEVWALLVRSKPGKCGRTAIPRAEIEVDASACESTAGDTADGTAGDGCIRTPDESKPEHRATKLCVKLVRPTRSRGGTRRFDVDAVYKSIPEKSRRNTGVQGMYNARYNVKRRLGTQYGTDNSAPVARFDDVWAELTKTIPRADVELDASACEADDDGETVVGGTQPDCEASTSADQTVCDALEPTETLTYEYVMRKVRRVEKKGHELEGYGSVYDVVQLVTECQRKHCSEKLEEIEGTGESGTFKEYLFPGQGQNVTPVATLKTLLELTMVLGGNRAKAFRVRFAELLTRVFAGDTNMHAELERNRATTSVQDRRDLLRGVPGAAPVRAPDRTSPPNEVHEANGTIVRTSARSSAPPANAHLRAIPDIQSVTLPREIALKPGVYLGAKGMFTDVNGTDWVHLKLGKHDYAIDSRIDEHALECPHWVTFWAGAATNPVCTPRMIETKMRVHAKRCPEARALASHQNEEFIVPLEHTTDAVAFITSETERVLAQDVFGCLKHAAVCPPENFEPRFDAAKYVQAHAPSMVSPDPEVSKFAIEKRAEVDIALKELDVAEKLLRDGIITVQEFFASRGSRAAPETSERS